MTNLPFARRQKSLPVPTPEIRQQAYEHAIGQMTERALSEGQLAAVQWLVDHDEALLWADVGTGKTAIALSALARLYLAGKIKGAVIFAPLRVSKFVWPEEVQHWLHLRDLPPIVSVSGKGPAKRRELIKENAFVVCNYELLKWMKTEFPEGPPNADVLVFDEIDKMKNRTSRRWIAACGLRKMMYRADGRRAADPKSAWIFKFARRWGMTGTPSPNHLVDLWAQVACIDGRVRLGKSYRDNFEEQYFSNHPFKQYEKEILPGMAGAIQDKVSDLVFRLETETTADTPNIQVLPARRVVMPGDVKKLYNRMKRHYLLSVKGDEVDEPFKVSTDGVGELTLEADNAGVAYNYMRQMAQGHIYVGGVCVDLHMKKYDELRDLLSELQGAQCLIAYAFTIQREVLAEDFGVPAIGSGSDDESLIKQWNAGEIETLAVHPMSAGHGLNLQHAGAHHICLLSLPESAGLYEQVVGRLARRGNSAATVYVHSIECEGTVDDLSRDSVARKIETQQELLAAMRQT